MTIKSRLCVWVMGLGIACAAVMGAPVAADVSPHSAPTFQTQPPSPQAAIEIVTQKIESGTLDEKQLADAYFMRGVFKFRLRDIDGALDDYSHAIHLNDQFLYRESRGAAYVVKADYQDALTDFAEVVRLRPNSPLGHLSRATVFKKMGDSAGYDAETKLAMALMPQPNPPPFDRADADFFAGDFEKAIAGYDAALAIKADSPDIISDRGDAKEMLGRFEDAIADYDAAISMDPDHSRAPTAPRNRLIALYGLGRYQDAADSATVAAQINPGDAYILFWWIYSRSRLGALDMVEIGHRAEKVDHSKWPWPIIAHFLGLKSEQQVWDAADVGTAEDVQGQRCEFQFHIGEWKRIHGDGAGAAALLKLAGEECPPAFAESIGARIELRNLGEPVKP